MNALDTQHSDARAEHTHIDVRSPRHFDVEIGIDDIVVAPPRRIAAVGFDVDVVAATADFKLDMVEPLARRPSNRLDQNVLPVFCADVHASREALQVQRAARVERQRPADPFDVVFCSLNAGGSEGDERKWGESEDKPLHDSIGRGVVRAGSIASFPV